MAPDIVPTSPQGLALQAEIQKKLADFGWSTEEDSVMAEYCLVMLGNRKTPDQISAELSDLIGSDFDRSFVEWMFDAVKRHYPEPSAAAAAAAAPPAAPSSAASPPTGPSSSSASSASRREGPNGVPSRPAGPLGGGASGGRQVFGAAMSGMKRSARDGDDAADGRSGDGSGRQLQRARYDGPSGGRQHNQRSLFDRVNGNNPQFAPGRPTGPVNNTGMPQPAFDAITQAVNAILAGAHPSILANIPFAALTAHPFSSRLPPQVMAQAQANAAMQAQAFAAMQNVWNQPPGASAFGVPPAGGPVAAPGGGVFNPNAAPFQPGGGASGPGGFAAGRTPTKPSGPPVVLPTKPTNDAICKHGVECSKPQCPYAHPSPVATKESGLVLSSDACEKQLKCEDPDCPKAHVSKAQKTHPPSSVSSGTTAIAPPRPALPAESPAGGALAGAGEKPCKFGAACTRQGCVFVHPWDVRGDPSAQVMCRYGAACTRADCHFKHPAHRPAPYSRNKFSATFNKSGSPASTAAGGSGASGKATEGSIAPKPEESAEHVSERLKRFAGSSNSGETERILPGQASTASNGEAKKNGNGAHDEQQKVEIHLDDEEDKKVEVKA